MESFWQVAVGVAGLGAIAAFVFWSLYRGWLKLGIFAKLTRKQTFILMVMFLILTFLALVLLIVAFVYQGSPPPENPEARLQELILYVRQGGDDATIEPLTLVKQGEVVAQPVVMPLGPQDDFKILGQFDHPQRWQLFWFDTNGKIEIVARSEKSHIDIEYPAGDQMVAVNQADPEGIHLLLLTTGRLPTSSEQDVLASLEDVGQLPTGDPTMLQPKRGPGELKDTAASLHASFLSAVEESLGNRLNSKFAFYLETT